MYARAKLKHDVVNREGLIFLEVPAALRKDNNCDELGSYDVSQGMT